jgi:hypothetical protein
LVKVHDPLLLSRRQLIGALGAASVVGFPGCNGTSKGDGGVTPSVVATSATTKATVTDGYTDQQSFSRGIASSPI